MRDEEKRIALLSSLIPSLNLFPLAYVMTAGFAALACAGLCVSKNGVSGK
jgi:hypothetical protein